MGTAPKEVKIGSGPFEVDIRVEKIGHERAFVVPGRFHTGKDETKLPSISWKNCTTDFVRVWFPFGLRIFENRVERKDKDGKEVKRDAISFVANTFDIPAGGTLTLFVSDNAIDGTYHYHVYCEAIHESAQGNSEPEVVVP